MCRCRKECPNIRRLFCPRGCHIISSFRHNIFQSLCNLDIPPCGYTIYINIYFQSARSHDRCQLSHRVMDILNLLTFTYYSAAGSFTCSTIVCLFNIQSHDILSCHFCFTVCVYIYCVFVWHLNFYICFMWNSWLCPEWPPHMPNTVLQSVGCY
jgi:hypothetical protein